MWGGVIQSSKVFHLLFCKNLDSAGANRALLLLAYIYCNMTMWQIFYPICCCTTSLLGGRPNL